MAEGLEKECEKHHLKFCAYCHGKTPVTQEAAKGLQAVQKRGPKLELIDRRPKR